MTDWRSRSASVEGTKRLFTLTIIKLGCRSLGFGFSEKMRLQLSRSFAGNTKHCCRAVRQRVINKQTRFVDLEIVTITYVTTYLFLFFLCFLPIGAL